MKDRRSEWRGDPLSHRSQRSRSPLMSYKRQQRPQMRPHRFSGRRSASRERGQDHILRRSDHGMDLVHNHSPPPQDRYRSLSPLSLRDDGFRYQHNYILPDHPSVNPSWKTSQSIKDREFHSPINEALPPSSLDIEEQGTLRQKSTFIGEGSSRSLYVDHPMGSTTVLSSDRMRRGGDSFGMGIQEVEMHSYNDGLRDPYDDTDRRHIHSRDLFIPKFPSSQLRPFSSTSSSSILKEEVKGLHCNPMPDGFGTGISRYPNDPLEYYAYNEVPKPDPLRHGLLDESRIYDYDEQPRGLDDHRHRVLDEPYKMMPCASRIELRDATSSTILDYPRDLMEKDDSTKRNLIQRTFSDGHHYLHRDVPHDYDDVRARQELLAYSGNWHGELKSKSLRDYESMPFEEGYASEKVFLPISHRDEYRNRKSLLSDHDIDEHRLSMSTHDRSHMDGLGDYDIERMESRNYGIIKNIDDIDSRALFMNDRHSFAPYESEEMWPTEEPVEPSLPKSRLKDPCQYRKLSRSRGISTSDAFMLSSGASSKHAESDLNINLKRRLKDTRSDFHNPYFSERREDLFKSYKYWKRGMQYRLGVQGRGTHDSDAHVMKNDPPEDSEEFKQQVHKAFLRYSKLLNENQHNQRIYQTQGKTYSLLCSVCGSNSKEFVDTNSLVSHSYHSRKVGLKTEHLGFHKAVCVLLGWNWRVRPENSRAYQSMPVAEVKAMREDLILWPPLVIIHNILIGDNSSTKDARVVTVESLEKILRDMGFGGAGKIRISLGKPAANQSIFTVKFMPTFSGLQTAERLHKHFADKKCGKEEFQQISPPRGNSSEGDEFLYGYIAVAEDLYKLDPETKKRSLLKSKKDDIEAIADAPLNTH